MATLASGKLSELFEDFLKSVADRSGNLVYRTKISQLISVEGKSLVVDFGDLLRYNGDLANRVLLEPDSSLPAFRTAAFETMRSENALYADRAKRELKVRIRGIPDQVPLRKVDTSYLDRMLSIAGMVVRTSELRPLMTEAAWVCPSGHLTFEMQDDLALKKPPKCEICGELRNFELDRKQSRYVDFQILRIQELPEELPPGQLPQFFDVNVEGDIVNMARPGDRVVLSGILRAVPDYSLGQVRTRLFRSQIDCNHVEVRGKEPEQVQVTKEDEALIKSISRSTDSYEKLINSVAPVIMGHQIEKEAILLLLAGGSSTLLPDGTKLRGDINVLFVGDPGTAKSEMLKFASQVAPRGLYASGRGTTAAGLSAAVIREKNVLMLEAGVVVLADLGIAAIDEFDKMKPEDRTALHEMMEQQSYHPSTEIMLSGGSKVAIGDLVERFFRDHSEQVIQGRDCEIVPLSGELKMRSIGPDGRDFEAPVHRVSRHTAPSSFVRITYTNGRSIVVTPEHPVFVFHGQQIETIPSSKVEVGQFAPAPLQIATSMGEVEHSTVNPGPGAKTVIQQQTISRSLGRVLGYLITEGNFHRGRTTEIDFGNFNQDLLDDMRAHADPLFGFSPIVRRTGDKNTCLRYVSKTLLEWFEGNFPEMARKSRLKRVPSKVMGAPADVVREFLAAAYLGDGSLESTALCYRTASEGLAEDYQDLLMRFKIATRIQFDRSNDSFKVYITGDSLPHFFETIVERIDPRYDAIKAMAQKSVSHERSHDSFPTEVIGELVSLRRRLGLAYDGRYWRHEKRAHGITRKAMTMEVSSLWAVLELATAAAGNALELDQLRTKLGWSQQHLAELAGLPRGTVAYLEAGGYDESTKAALSERLVSAVKVELEEIRMRLQELQRLMAYRFLRIRKVEEVKNEGEFRTQFVYDVTVEPTHNFVSNGLILHNTVTIAKGGIYASLNARTAILAACNPVLGRYNPFQNLTDNISALPIPLLTRFDLIFVVRDQPAPAEDEKLATHILSVHQRKSYTAPPPIEFSLLKKYISYAKKLSPTLTKEAVQRLKDYYLELRRMGGEEGQIPATPRTLESLVRIATARARILLRDEVTEDDALGAIALMNRMVEDVLTDASTKKTDFGIQMGKPVGETRNLRTAMELFKTLEGAEKRPVERKLFKEELLKSKFTDEDAEKMIRTMFREGLIYESKPGYFRRVGA